MSDDRAFIEALREVLGLGPLYGEPLSRGRGFNDEEREMRRFHPPEPGLGLWGRSDGRVGMGTKLSDERTRP